MLLVADLFHPVNGFAVELFLNGDVRQGRGGRGTVPMFLAGRKPDRVARPDSFNRPPQRCARPQPAVTIKVCPSGCVCHAVRAPGSNVTTAPETRAGSLPLNLARERTRGHSLFPVFCN